MGHGQGCPVELRTDRAMLLELPNNLVPVVEADTNPLSRRVGDALTARWGERLSWRSSGLPWFLVSEDGVEDGEQLSGDGDDRDYFRFAGRHEARKEGFQ